MGNAVAAQKGVRILLQKIQNHFPVALFLFIKRHIAPDTLFYLHSATI